MSWALAILTEIGSKRRRGDEQQSWRPHGAMPSMTLVGSRAPGWGISLRGGGARGDLAHLDPRVELAREVAHELAEVHALLGVERDHHPAHVGGHLDVHDLHREPAAPRQLLGHRDRALLALAALAPVPGLRRRGRD